MRRQLANLRVWQRRARPDLVINGAESANPASLFTVTPCGRKRLWCNKVIYESENCEMVSDNGSRDLQAETCVKLTVNLRARKSHRCCSRHLEPRRTVSTGARRRVFSGRQISETRHQRYEGCFDRLHHVVTAAQQPHVDEEPLMSRADL